MKRSVIILLISIPLFVVLLFVSSIFIATHSQEKNLQEKIGNPIILSGYEDWKEVEIDGNILVMIPADWQVGQSNNQIFLLDSKGAKVAVGQKSADSIIETDEADLFVEGICKEKVISSEPVHFSPYFYGNLASAWIRNCVLENGKSSRFVSVELPYYNEYAFLFCFFSESDEPFYCDIAEAIAYSMHYQE